MEDGRQRVGRHIGEQHVVCTFNPTVSFQGSSVMVWAGVSMEAHTLCVVPRDSLTAERYIKEILQDHVVLYAPYIKENFLFMHDNVHPHVAQTAHQYLLGVNVPVMDWPALSPGLNPIEHVCDMGRG